MSEYTDLIAYIQNLEQELISLKHKASVMERKISKEKEDQNKKMVQVIIT